MPPTALRAMMHSKAMLGGVAAVAALSVGGATAGYAALNKDVTLSVDGSQRSVSAMADTVGDVLESEGIEIGAHDRVAPGVDQEISDGAAITVRYGRPFTLTVDGKERTYWVTATTVDGALDEIGRTFAAADLSASRSASVSRDGADLEVVTPKTVKVTVAGKKPAKHTVVAKDVRDVLDELGVSVQGRDKVKPGLKSRVSDGDAIVFTNIEVKQRRNRSEAIGFDTVQRENSDLLEGRSNVVREGRAGARDVTYRLRFVNGKQVNRSVVRSSVVRQPVDKVVEIGTKEPAPEPAPAPAANYAAGGTVWDRLAQCESGGNWAINTGNGYYGGLQFTLSTWRAYGGSGYPHHASRSAQIAVAQRVQAGQGWGAWPACTSKLGIR